MALLLLVCSVSYAGVWACYRFTYAVTPGDTTWPAVDDMRRQTPVNEIRHHDPSHVFSESEIGNWKPSLTFRAYDWADRHHLLPQAYLAGLLFQHNATQVWSNFLLDQIYINGRWYYFPLAIVFKEPVSVLVAMMLGILVLCRHFPKSRVWDMACLSWPAMVFFIAAMTSSLNFGIRHIFPTLAIAYIAIGCASALVMKRWRTIGITAIAIILVGEAVETAAVFPDYIAYFNYPSGGSRGGIHLLTDSNLDWGQDAKLLARWQKEHPNEPLYLCLYGAVDPAYYGVKYKSLPGAVSQAPVDPTLTSGQLPPGVLGISATILQGVYLPARLREAYQPLLQQKPIAVLGGTIYLFRVGEPPAMPPH